MIDNENPKDGTVGDDAVAKELEGVPEELLDQTPDRDEEGTLDEKEKEELRSNLEQMEIGGDNVHMDQSDVDNLLSSLGF